MKRMKHFTGIVIAFVIALMANPVSVFAAEEEAEKSLGEVMGKALLNTVMGISIVFCSLLLISFIISLFKYINKFEQKMAAKKAQAAPVTPSAPAAVDTETEELVDDLELVAVITAAIHAYEESQGNYVPADGLVVRSIRKSNKKWQNA